MRVTPIETPQTQTAPSAGGGAPPTRTLRELLLSYAGRAKGLPSDLARNHDHYIHGTPRE